MKITLLDIKGFGRFNQKKIAPKYGFNIVYESNESGKSTLQAFIRAMLFGLKGGRKSKDGKLPPLKQYKPWGNDQYAGIMEYTLDNGKSYRVGRNFEKGTVNIYDQGANNLTSEFPHERDRGPKFAYEHLGIDAEVFDRSAFIGQLQTIIDAEGKKGLIERLSNLGTTGNEDMSLDSTINALESTLLEKVGTKNSTTRPLDRLNNRISALIQEKEELEAQREKYMDTISQLHMDKEALAKFESDLAFFKAQRKSTEKRELLALQRESEGLLNKLNELDEGIKQCHQELINLKEYENYNQEELIEISGMLEEVKQIQDSLLTKQTELREVKEKCEEITDTLDPDELFEKKTTDVTEAIKEYNESKQEGASSYSSAGTGAGRQKPKRDWRPFLISAGLISAILLTVQFFQSQDPLSLGIAIVAAVFSITIILRKKNKDLVGSGTMTEADRLKDILLKSGFTDMINYIHYRESQIKGREKKENYSHQIKNLEEEIEQLIKRKDAILRSWDKFASHHYLNNDSHKEKLIESIKQGVEAIKRANEKKQRLLLAKDTIYEKFQIVLKEASLMAGESFEAVDDLSRYIMGFDNQNGTDSPQVSMSQIDEEMKALEERINETKLRIASLEARAENAPDQSRIYSVIEELDSLIEKKSKLELRGEALALASQTIKSVATSMQKDYIPKLNSQMSKMMEKLSDKKYTKVMTNDELVINVVSPETEELISVNSLSGGTIDQIYLSMRLAAVTLLEKGRESIPLFLDEPFSQYDENRITKAFELLKDISKERQIFFFTCRQREYDLALEVFGQALNRISLQ